jgi:hypothetical protein
MTVLIAALTVVILIVGGYLIAAHFSAVSFKYVCEGETRRLDGPPQKDTARLRVDDYGWWVGLWSDSQGALFESKSIGHALKLNKSGGGNFSYTGLAPGTSFLFRRSTGELAIQHQSDGQLLYAFVGECKEAQSASVKSMLD